MIINGPGVEDWLVEIEKFKVKAQSIPQPSYFEIFYILTPKFAEMLVIAQCF